MVTVMPGGAAYMAGFLFERLWVGELDRWSRRIGGLTVVARGGWPLYALFCDDEVFESGCCDKPSGERLCPSALWEPVADRLDGAGPPRSRRRRRRRVVGTAGRLEGAASAVTSAIRDGRVLPRRPACALAAFLLLFTALAVAAPSAQAQAPSSLVSNTAETSNGFSNGRQAQSFTTGSNPAGYSLSEVRLSLTELIIQYTGYTTAVKIRENNDSDQPGDVVATLTNPASLTAGALNTFTAPADTTLSADTVYWVYVNDGIPRIKTSFVTTRSDSQTGLTGWSIADTRLSWIHASGSWVRSPRRCCWRSRATRTVRRCSRLLR